MAFEILSGEGETATRWTALVARLPSHLRDIHFLPEYGRIYREAYGFTPFLAVHFDADNFVLQPFVRRPLQDLPFLAEAADKGAFSDIANPYGYGGPLSNVSESGAAQGLYGKFAELLSAWCCSEQIASEFTSLHPFMAQHQRSLVDGVLAPEYAKEVVFIGLDADGQRFKESFRKGHRSSISAAVRAGIQVARVVPTAANLKLFNEMYEETMVRRNAADRWFVPEDYFERCIVSLGEKRASLVFAYVGDRLESGCLLIHDFDTAYYHFAATYANHPASGVNNLMVFEAANIAGSMGYRRLHLGGGVTGAEDDSLLRFKAGFSNLRAPLYTYFSIRDRAAYERLCTRKRAYEVATAGAESLSDFVPVYRR
jgi:hypothetical protein